MNSFVTKAPTPRDPGPVEPIARRMSDSAMSAPWAPSTPTPPGKDITNAVIYVEGRLSSGGRSDAATPPPPFISQAAINSIVIKPGALNTVVLPPRSTADHTSVAQQGVAIGNLQAQQASISPRYGGAPPVVVVHNPQTLVTQVPHGWTAGSSSTGQLTAQASGTPVPHPAALSASGSHGELNATWPVGNNLTSSPTRGLAHELLSPMAFHFYKDPNSRGEDSEGQFPSAPASLGAPAEPTFTRDLDLPPPPPSILMEGLHTQHTVPSNHMTACAPAPEDEKLEAVKATTSNMATQIQEMMTAQNKLRDELEEVRMLVTNNFHDLEDFRREAQGRLLPPQQPQHQQEQREWQQQQLYQQHPPVSPQMPVTTVYHNPATQSARSLPWHHQEPDFLAQQTPAARNLGYGQTETLLSNLSGTATRGLGALHSHATRALRSVSDSANPDPGARRSRSHNPRPQFHSPGHRNGHDDQFCSCIG